MVWKLSTKPDAHHVVIRQAALLDRIESLLAGRGAEPQFSLLVARQLIAEMGEPLPEIRRRVVRIEVRPAELSIENEAVRA